MQQYMRIFSKNVEDDFIRYWASVSTEKTKDGKGTGKYARANITCRLSRDAEETFKTKSEKTKTKGIRQLNGKVDGWLKAAETKEGESFLFLFVNTIEPADIEDDEEDD